MNMTVEELIKQLEKVKDKTKRVIFDVYEDDAEFCEVIEYNKTVQIEQRE